MEINWKNPSKIDEWASGEYLSPIVSVESVVKDVVNRIDKEKEKHIMATLECRYGIDVDKDELIKALNYDRGQYGKGYRDGYMKAVAMLREDADGCNDDECDLTWAEVHHVIADWLEEQANKGVR